MKCILLTGAGKKNKCDLCSKTLGPRRRRWCSTKCNNIYWKNHSYSQARKAARRRDGYKCIVCGTKDRLEVNHIVPCLGKHNTTGCWHHLENLETLCHKHHLEATALQRANGAFNKPKKRKRKK